MKIAVISDLHLGRGDLADRRRDQDEELLALLDYLEAHYERIILLGDVWALLTPKCPGWMKRELKKVREAHPQLAQRFASSPYDYIVGNHDRAVEFLEHKPQELLLKTDQITILFTHGHQFDLWAHQLRYVGEFVVWISGWAARFGTQALTRFFDWTHNLLTGTSTLDHLGALEQKLIQYAQTHHAHITVMGHTHIPGIIKSQGHFLVNSGHCLGHLYHFVSIDSQSKEIAVYQVNQSKSVSFDESNLRMIDHATLS